MTNDFGARSRPRGAPLGLLAGVAVVLVIGGFFGLNYFLRRPAAIAEAEQWTVNGPPCRQVDAAAFTAQAPKPSQVFAFEDITFARSYGQVSCNEIKSDGGKGLSSLPVCQFSSPGGLVVNDRAGVHYFAPGVGQPVTVSAPHGRLRCVLGAKFPPGGWPTGTVL
jgi:hypothetical protein